MMGSLTCHSSNLIFWTLWMEIITEPNWQDILTKLNGDFYYFTLTFHVVLIWKPILSFWKAMNSFGDYKGMVFRIATAEQTESQRSSLPQTLTTLPQKAAWSKRICDIYLRLQKISWKTPLLPAKCHNPLQKGRFYILCVFCVYCVYFILRKWKCNTAGAV